jgi:glycosyltransferase involved in cell wall biosynthesis
VSERVLVLSSTFPQYAGDPRGQFILRHWEARAAAGARVRFLVPETAWVRGGLVSSCEVVRFRYAPRGWSSLTGQFGILENIRDRPWRAALVLPFMAALRRAMQAELRGFRPDLVVAHMFLPCGMVAAELARAAGVACEVYGHGTDVDLTMRLPGLMRARVLQALLSARRVYLPSREKLVRFAALVEGRTELAVETMVSGLAGHVVMDRSVRPEPSILFLGRLIAQKGVDDLLAAAALLPGRPRVDIAGDGPERRRLQGMAAELALDARFHGFVEEAARDALYRRSALLCVPSREIAGLSEGAPLVIAEAQQYGLPVVATAVGGIPELMAQAQPGSALVRPGAPALLAEALGRGLQLRCG